MEKITVSLRYVILLAVVAFLLHLIWENTQAPLYSGYQSFSRHFPICFVATFGDVVITLSALAFMRLFKKDISHPADFLGLAIVGFLIAVVIEQHALLAGKWSYAPSMPIVPILKVGLVPVLQMTLLLPLSFYLAGFFTKHKQN